MADTKISALPAATTPLAGTEVLPVVQGGTTDKVSVANLTAGRAVQMSSLDANGGSSTGGAIVSGSVSGVRASSTVVDIGDGHRYLALGANTSTIGLIKLISASSNASIYNYIAESDSNSNFRISTGNLVIGTSGKGIDFSATPGTGTSELFSDYEEGTWTPAVASDSGSITSFTATGTYTKIGRSVFLNFDVTITNNGTGATSISLSSLPFVIRSTYAAAGVFREVAATGTVGAVFNQSTTTVSLNNFNNGYPGGTNYRLVGSIAYPV